MDDDSYRGGVASADDELARAFEQQRTHLRAVAYRLLGSVQEADDAVQEAWLRLARTDPSGIESLPAWLTTVVSRICLDQLRARANRREEHGGLAEDLAAGQLGGHRPDLLSAARGTSAEDPAAVAEQADAVGRALLVVLDALAPAERLAFCLHDLFGLSFDEIAPVLGRSSAACRQLASRGRRRIRGQGDSVEADRVRQREAVDAFMLAAREGRFDALVRLLHPEAVVVSDEAAAAMGSPALLAGRQAVAQFFNGRARGAHRAELDGFAAAMWMHQGEVRMVFDFTVEDGLIRELHLIAGGLDLLDLR